MVEAKFITEGLKQLYEKLNIYIFPQVLWLISIHYFLVNSILKAFLKYSDKRNLIFQDAIPDELILFNNYILSTFNTWSLAVLLLSISLIICSILVYLLRYVPLISNYRVIYDNADYAGYLGVWLVLISLSYGLFYVSQSNFWLVYLIIVLGIIGVKWIYGKSKN